MRKLHLAADTISSELRRIAEISQTPFGSEDDLIHKIILPFFQEIGYGPDSFELKFPVKAASRLWPSLPKGGRKRCSRCTSRAAKRLRSRICRVTSCRGLGMCALMRSEGSAAGVSDAAFAHRFSQNRPERDGHAFCNPTEGGAVGFRL